MYFEITARVEDVNKEFECYVSLYDDEETLLESKPFIFTGTHHTVPTLRGP